MKNRYLFFRSNNEETPLKSAMVEWKVLGAYQIEIFTPTLFRLKKHKANKLLYLFWFMMTWGRYSIIYLRNEDELIHYTHTLPRFFKLPFLGANDLEIGPAWTNEAYRGKGIFPAVINYAVQTYREKGRSFYIFSHMDNIASQKAIEKAKFSVWGKGYKTDVLGIYKVETLIK